MASGSHFNLILDMWNTSSGGVLSIMMKEVHLDLLLLSRKAFSHSNTPQKESHPPPSNCIDQKNFITSFVSSRPSPPFLREDLGIIVHGADKNLSPSAFPLMEKRL